MLYYLHDIVDETHIQHTVSLIEHEEGTAGEIKVAHLQMTQQSARCSNEHISTKAHTAQLLFVASTIITTIDSHRRHIVEVIAEALHSLIYLLSKFAGGGHHDTIDGIFGIVTVVEHREDRQQVGGSLTRTRLCHT